MRTHLDVCSGIGGFALAARWAGLQTVGFVEIDPWCRRVLAHHWPEVPQHDDLKTIAAATVADWLAGQRLDILTGGYPCQPFSVAGKRRGAGDDRHLWPWISGLVRDLRPRWCLFENVAGHVRMGLDDVLLDLESQNYACWPVVIPAAGVGAPHRRDRVWIISHDNQDVADAYGPRFKEQWSAIPDAPQHSAVECRSASSEGDETIGGVGDSIDGLPRWLVGPSIVNPWAGDWERSVGRVTAGEVDRRHKLKGLGNAIVPQVAYQIMRAVIEADSVGQ
jgi:DNA (cytosine-5)-methyltransferase 1